MTRFIALLRGINVGGRKSVPMAELGKLLESQGFSNVVTYIQSGNAVFSSSMKEAAIQKKIEEALLARFGFEVIVFVLSSSKLSSFLKANPFAKRSLHEGERIYFTLLSSKPEPANAAKLSALNGQGDELVAVGDVVYIFCRGGYGRSAFSNPAVEKILKLSATTRNSETMKKLDELAAG